MYRLIVKWRGKSTTFCSSLFNSSGNPETMRFWSNWHTITLPSIILSLLASFYIQFLLFAPHYAIIEFDPPFWSFEFSNLLVVCLISSSLTWIACILDRRYWFWSLTSLYFGLIDWLGNWWICSFIGLCFSGSVFNVLRRTTTNQFLSILTSVFVSLSATFFMLFNVINDLVWHLWFVHLGQ